MLKYKIRPATGEYHTIIALQAPLSLGLGSYAWYPIEVDANGAVTSEVDATWSAVDLLIQSINLLKERYSLDPKDLSVLGFSQGAILSWALGFHNPNKIRRIMPISGFLHENVNTKNKPTFIAYATHGIEDAVIPIEKARENIVPLSRENPDIHYKEFNDGHTISQDNFSELLKWIEKTNL